MQVEKRDGRAGNQRDHSNTLLHQAERAKPLTTQQKKAVELLCAGLVPKCVAEALGVSKQCLNRWRSLPAFKWAVSDAMQIDADLHGVRLKALYGKALDRVSELLDDPSPHIRVQAARLAFEAEQNIARALEEQQMLHSLEQRMDALAQGGAFQQTPFISEDVIDVEDEKSHS